MRRSFSSKPAQAPLGLLLVLMVAPLAALDLRCEVVPVRGGLRLQLRPGPDSELPQDCSGRSWEDGNRTVLTRGLVMNKTRVRNVTDWTLELKECLDLARFTAECSVPVEATCRMNCSEAAPHAEAQDPPLGGCGAHCVAAIVVPVVAMVILAIGLTVWKCKRQRKLYIQAQNGPANHGDPEHL